jgi:hypothetical protein
LAQSLAPVVFPPPGLPRQGTSGRMCPLSA